MNINDSVLIVASYEKLMVHFERALRQKGYHFKTIVAGKVTEKGRGELWDKIQTQIQGGTSIIIARGTIAQQIQEKFSVQVVKLEVTDYDILNVLLKYRNSSKSIAVVECEDFVKKVVRIGTALGMDVVAYVTKTIDMMEAMTEAAESNHQVIITGAWAEVHNYFFTEYPVAYEMLECTEESICNSIDQAVELYNFACIETEKRKRLKTIIDYSFNAVIAVDKNGCIDTFNMEAESVLGVPGESALGKPIKVLLPEIDFDLLWHNRQAQTNCVLQRNRQEIIYNFAPLIVENSMKGAVLTFKNWQKMEIEARKIRTQLSAKGLSAKYDFSMIIGENQHFLETIHIAKIYAQTHSTVLITGETGVGKELFAQSIHNESSRKDAPFVAINCSALSENLLQSELFGYVDGAFTGARKSGKAGIFELAHTGTIFLDEIGKINPIVQNQLLRVIQEREIMRIGDDKIIPVDVRIIAATNQDLYEEVLNGTFRSDLYFRLNILTLPLPTLRERKSDIPLLIKGMLTELNQMLQCTVEGVDDEVMEYMLSYDWPGNIRELRNTLEKIVVLTKKGVAAAKDIAPVLRDIKLQLNAKQLFDSLNTLEDQEKNSIIKALLQEKGNQSKTAVRLGIDRSTLIRKIKKYDI